MMVRPLLQPQQSLEGIDNPAMEEAVGSAGQPHYVLLHKQPPVESGWTQGQRDHPYPSSSAVASGLPCYGPPSFAHTGGLPSSGPPPCGPPSSGPPSSTGLYRTQSLTSSNTDSTETNSVIYSSHGSGPTCKEQSSQNASGLVVGTTTLVSDTLRNPCSKMFVRDESARGSQGTSLPRAAVVSGPVSPNSSGRQENIPLQDVSSQGASAAAAISPSSPETDGRNAGDQEKSDGDGTVATKESGSVINVDPTCKEKDSEKNSGAISKVFGPGRTYHHIKDMFYSRFGSKSQSPGSESVDGGGHVQTQNAGTSTQDQEGNSGSYSLNNTQPAYKSPQSGRHSNINTSFRRAIQQSTQKSNLQEDSLQIVNEQQPTLEYQRITTSDRAAVSDQCSAGLRSSGRDGDSIQQSGQPPGSAGRLMTGQVGAASGVGELRSGQISGMATIYGAQPPGGSFQGSISSRSSYMVMNGFVGDTEQRVGGSGGHITDMGPRSGEFGHPVEQLQQGSGDGVNGYFKSPCNGIPRGDAPCLSVPISSYCNQPVTVVDRSGYQFNRQDNGQYGMSRVASTQVSGHINRTAEFSGDQHLSLGLSDMSKAGGMDSKYSCGTTLDDKQQSGQSLQMSSYQQNSGAPQGSYSGFTGQVRSGVQNGPLHGQDTQARPNFPLQNCDPTKTRTAFHSLPQYNDRYTKDQFLNSIHPPEGFQSGHQSGGSSDYDKKSGQSNLTSDSGHGTSQSGQMGRSRSAVSGALDTSLDSEFTCSKENTYGITGHSSGNDSEWVDTVESELRQLLDPKLLPGMPGSHFNNSNLSESMSVTPPLPPLSPGNTPVVSPASSPNLASKYKLSYSATHLNKPDLLEPTASGPVANQHFPKSGPKTYVSSPKGNSVRRTASINQGNSRGWSKGKNSSTEKQKSGRRDPSPIKSKGNKIQLNPVPSLGSLTDTMDNGDITSTTTALDLESMLDGQTEVTSDDDLSTTIDMTDSQAVRKQLEGLENMYSEVLKVLGVKRFGGSKHQLSELKNSKRRLYGSLSSLPSSVGGRHFKDKRRQDDRKKVKGDKNISKRFQRLESHVVTLARSVAHLSSEMRTQHLMIQEIENIRSEIAQLRTQPMMRPQHTTGSRMARTAAEWESFRGSVPSLTNPNRVKKLTKFFGDEPPLLRLFLKKLGYEKYASIFETEKIGMIELPYLTEERLQKIGIPMGPRMRIIQEAQLSFRQENFNIYIV